MDKVVSFNGQKCPVSTILSVQTFLNFANSLQFIKARYLSDHKRLQHKIGSYTCDECGEEFTANKLLQR
jgi:formylmethanofuran dehydrogenase subunit E